MDDSIVSSCMRSWLPLSFSRVSLEENKEKKIPYTKAALLALHRVDLLPENRTKKEGGNGHAIWYKNYYVLLKVSLSREYWDWAKLTRFKTVIPHPMIHNGYNWRKTADKQFIQSDFSRFSMQVSAILHNFRFRLLALHSCRHKYDPTISRIC